MQYLHLVKGLGNVWPLGCMWPVRPFDPACKAILKYQNSNYEIQKIKENNKNWRLTHPRCTGLPYACAGHGQSELGTHHILMTCIMATDKKRTTDAEFCNFPEKWTKDDSFCSSRERASQTPSGIQREVSGHVKLQKNM